MAGAVVIVVVLVVVAVVVVVVVVVVVGGAFCRKKDLSGEGGVGESLAETRFRPKPRVASEDLFLGGRYFRCNANVLTYHGPTGTCSITISDDLSQYHLRLRRDTISYIHPPPPSAYAFQGKLKADTSSQN